jgi:4-hydroxymandelate oxidase
LVGEPPGRIAPHGELVNTFEFEAMAERKLDSATFAAIAGSDRKAFDRITLDQRLMVSTIGLDLSTDLFGDTLFSPILVGPTSHQKRYHPEGELAMARGASAGKAAMVVAGRSSYRIDEIAAQAHTPLWYQVYPGPDAAATAASVKQAVSAGCKAVCITVGTPYQAGGAGAPSLSQLPLMGNPGLDWAYIDRLRQGITVPVLLKGIMSPGEAQTAVERGVQGIVVSNHGGRFVTGLAQPISVLPAIADAVGQKIPILIDGGFRRGSDILKALALGARAVLLGRPALWGLAAYGADGVQAVIELLQTNLAGDMTMIGAPNLKAITRDMVRIHRR